MNKKFSIIGDGTIPYKLRKNYVENVSSISPDEWREVLRGVCNKCAKKVINALGNDISVIYPWRAGLSFAHSFVEAGVTHHYHLGISRDEENPAKTKEEWMPLSSFNPGEQPVVIADVMNATGGSIRTVLKKILELGGNHQVMVVNVIAAPEGVVALRSFCSKIRIITATLDDRLDARGYIVPGLGDAGDQFFEGITIEYFIPIRHIFSDCQWKILEDKIFAANNKV